MQITKFLCIIHKFVRWFMKIQFLLVKKLLEQQSKLVKSILSLKRLLS